jgi:hypothetical protein
VQGRNQEGEKDEGKRKNYEREATISLKDELRMINWDELFGPQTARDFGSPPDSLPLGHGTHDQHDQARRHRDRHFRFDG